MQLLFDLSITVTVLFFLSVLTQRLCNGWQCWRQRQQVIISFQGGAAAPDAKVARRKMTGLSNKVRPYHHDHPPSPHRHLHCPCCLLHGYIIRYSKSWLWTFMTRWIGGKRTPSGTRLRCAKFSLMSSTQIIQVWKATTIIILNSYTILNAFRCEVKARFLCHFYQSTQTTALPGTK